VFFGTVIIGSAIYFLQNHFYDFFFEEGKEIFISEIEKEWDEDLNYVKSTTEKDSLRILVKEFILLFRDFDDIISATGTDEKFAEAVSISFEDSLITEDEIKMLSDLFLKVKNEKLKSH
jgi:hypothetical protein